MCGRIPFVVAFLLAGLSVAGADFTVRIISSPSSTIQGASVTISGEITNSSGAPITVAYGANGFQVGFSVKRADGKTRRDNLGRPAIDYVPRYNLKELPAGWTQNLAQTYDCNDDPGQWIITMSVSCRGPLLQVKTGGGQEEVHAWTGIVQSPEIRLLIKEPTGIDKKAYLATNKCPMCTPDVLLKDFPTSTYAAYVIWEHSGAKGLGTGPATWAVKAVETGLLYRDELVLPCKQADGKMVMRRLAGPEAIECRAYWYDLILKAHPDIWFANELRIRRAMDQAALKNYQAAQAELEAIAKDDKAPMAPKAKEYLGLMKQKGWIKN